MLINLPAFLVLFWNTGILCWFESVAVAQSLHVPLQDRGLITEAYEHRLDAVQALTTVAGYIVSILRVEEADDSSSTQSGIPFIACHVNTALVVMALVKAIEHTVQTASTSSRSTHETSTTAGLPRHLTRSPKGLLICLSELDVTMAGFHDARPALQGLMRRYGDILMDCWSLEEDEIQNACVF